MTLFFPKPSLIFDHSVGEYLSTFIASLVRIRLSSVTFPKLVSLNLGFSPSVVEAQKHLIYDTARLLLQNRSWFRASPTIVDPTPGSARVRLDGTRRITTPLASFCSYVASFLDKLSKISAAKLHVLRYLISLAVSLGLTFDANN